MGLLTTLTEYLPGFQTRTTNPRGLQTVTQYQAFDQPSTDAPTGITSPESTATEIYRDVLGRTTSMKRRNTDGSLQQTRSYVYDSYSQLCKSIEPETGATVMDYDAAGNLAWSAAGHHDLTSTGSCNRDEGYGWGRRVNRSYDSRNRLISLSFPDGRGNQVWEYTSDGLPASISTYNAAGNGEPVINAYTYNKRRMLIGESVAQPGWYSWGIGYGYDANGSLSTQSYPTGLVVNYAPNALGQPTQAGSYATGVQYYPNGAIKQFTYGNGIVHTMTQNARQLPARSTASGGVLDQQYGYDANANVSSTIDYLDGARSRWMSYDGLDRLTAAGAAMFGGDHWHRFTYDALDNLKSWKLAGVKDYANYYYEPSTGRLTNIQNTAGSSVVGLGYDVQGNVTNKNGQAYAFDFGNRLRSVPNAAARSRSTPPRESYRYDGLGRRVQTTRSGTTQTLWQYSQAGQMLFSWDGPTAQKTHENVYLGGSLIATIDHDWPSNAVIATKYQHTDALGSPVAVTNTAGVVIERTNYEPYGAAINKTVNGIGYTGHVMDGATGLTYMQQRYYDPSIGRFLSVDPVAANPNTGAMFNRYVYANNNPYRFKDPDGRKCTTTDGKPACTFDEFKNSKGESTTREAALGGKLSQALGRGGRILRAEAGMTAKYTAAKGLAAKGGEVTIKGNAELKIPDQKVAGATIASHMESISTIADARESAKGPANIAGTPAGQTLGAPSNGPITFYRDGAGPSVGQTFGHEILHTIYSGSGLANGGWANATPTFIAAHQVPFDSASDEIK